MNNRKKIIRIAKNTVALYFRQVFIILVSLYTVRKLLLVLGETDYGIYNVIAGVVLMLNFISTTMASASQRYFSFELGRQNLTNVNKIFSLTLIIYLVFSIVILILSETLGLWFVLNKLTISEERLNSALIVYQLSILSFVFRIISSVYLSVILAYEDMNIYAYISLIDAVLRLLSVVLLSMFTYDYLILYGVFTTIISFLITLIYLIVVVMKYKDIKHSLHWEKDKFFEMLSYVGWNLFGGGVSVVKSHGINLLLNIFFGPLINTSRAISLQVRSAVISFAQNFSMALKPQIIKSYSSNNISEMHSLLFQSARISFFLMFIFTNPFILSMDSIMILWLDKVPENTIIFAQLALVDSTIDCINFPLVAAAQATGKVKKYQSVIGSVLLLNLPLSYIALKLYTNPLVVFYISIILTIISSIIRILFLRKLIELDLKSFFKKVYIRIFLIVIVQVLVNFLLSYVSILNTNFVVYFIATLLTTIANIIILGLDVIERNKLIKIIINYMVKTKNMLRSAV